MRQRSPMPETGAVRTAPAKPSTALRLDRVVVFIAVLLLGALALSSPLLAGINGMRIAACRSGDARR